MFNAYGTIWLPAAAGRPISMIHRRRRLGSLRIIASAVLEALWPEPWAEVEPKEAVPSGEADGGW